MVNDRTTFRTAFRTWKENVQRSRHMAYIHNRDDGADADDAEPAEIPARDRGRHAEDEKEVHIGAIARRVSGLGANVEAIRKSSQVCCLRPSPPAAFRWRCNTLCFVATSCPALLHVMGRCGRVPGGCRAWLLVQPCPLVATLATAAR